MEICILPSAVCRDAADLEVIEIKGRGHPDTLSDALAERLSQLYSRHTRDTFGAILHHNFDKVGLLGGKASVALGRGRMTSPVRVLLNGRASRSFGEREFDIDKMLADACRDFLVERLPKLDRDRDIVIFNNLSTGSSPGHVETNVDNPANRRHWFEPRSLGDVRELQRVTSNDTSVGCAYAPPSPAESFVLALERHLTDPDRLRQKPWQGTDIKIMARRTADSLRLTMCVPQIADHVPDLEAYRANLAEVHDEVMERARAHFRSLDIRLDINTKDDFEIPELYLTVTGSSIESGDEGLVGRGNRPNGLISMTRPFSMEGAAGKNPVYHVGKLYGIAAQQVADSLHEATGEPVQVWLISQEGRLLSDPWQTIVRGPRDMAEALVERTVRDVMDRLPGITDQLVAGAIRVY